MDPKEKRRKELAWGLTRGAVGTGSFLAGSTAVMHYLNKMKHAKNFRERSKYAIPAALTVGGLSLAEGIAEDKLRRKFEDIGDPEMMKDKVAEDKKKESALPWGIARGVSATGAQLVSGLVLADALKKMENSKSLQAAEKKYPKQKLMQAIRSGKGRKVTEAFKGTGKRFIHLVPRKMLHALPFALIAGGAIGGAKGIFEKKIEHKIREKMNAK